MLCGIIWEDRRAANDDGHGTKFLVGLLCPTVIDLGEDSVHQLSNKLTKAIKFF